MLCKCFDFSARYQINFDEQTKIDLVLQPKYICELFNFYNPYRKTPFRSFVLVLLFLSLLNLTDQNTRFSGCFIDNLFWIWSI